MRRRPAHGRRMILPSTVYSAPAPPEVQAYWVGIMKEYTGIHRAPTDPDTHSCADVLAGALSQAYDPKNTLCAITRQRTPTDRHVCVCKTLGSSAPRVLIFLPERFEVNRRPLALALCSIAFGLLGGSAYAGKARILVCRHRRRGPERLGRPCEPIDP
jgi:hypothetical protein